MDQPWKPDRMNGIGTLSENSLHAAIKQHLRQPGDMLEQKVRGFIVDIVRENTLCEIQIKNFYSLKPKLTRLLEEYQIIIIHPIPLQKWITRQDSEGKILGRRKSPKKGTILDIFNQLIYIPQFLTHPNLQMEILMIGQEDIFCNDGKGSWRRKGWSLSDQRLIEVYEKHRLMAVDDLIHLVRKNLPSPFQNLELASSLGCSTRLARKITYTLVKSGCLFRTGKKGRSILYDFMER